ncbi:MAG: two-component system response regulator [Chloroflexota bacterium]
MVSDRPRRVLVVEDDNVISELIRDTLADEGYEVRVATDGAVGLAELANWPADIVLLDLMMPVLGGAEFCAQKRSLTQGANVPVIILTARTDAAARAAELDVAGYLTKPFDLDDLISCVDGLLRAEY